MPSQKFAPWSNASSRCCSSGSLASFDRRSTKPKPSRGKPGFHNLFFHPSHLRKPAPSQTGKAVSGRCDIRHHAQRRASEGNCPPETNHQLKKSYVSTEIVSFHSAVARDGFRPDSFCWLRTAARRTTPFSTRRHRGASGTAGTGRMG